MMNRSEMPLVVTGHLTLGPTHSVCHRKQRCLRTGTDFSLAGRVMRMYLIYSTAPDGFHQYCIIKTPSFLYRQTRSHIDYWRAFSRSFNFPAVADDTAS